MQKQTKTKESGKKMAKKEILSRLNLKDYNNELEQILDRKDFQSQAKNLLLSMFYKLEIGYKDYIAIKKDSLSKEEFLEGLMNIIKEKCNKIELIKPNEEDINEKKHYAIPEENTIACYQNEASILHALLELDKKYFLMQNIESMLKFPLQEMLEEGYELDIKEVITNLDGWSWNNNFDKQDRIDFFLIYEILRILMGNSFMYEWKRDRRERNTNYLNEIRQKSEEIYEQICKYCIACNLNKKDFFNKKLSEAKKEIAKMEDKSKFVEEKYARKTELTDKIKQIDRALASRKILNEEFERRNEKLPEVCKIFSISDLEEILQKEKEQFVKEKDEISLILQPKKYLKKIQGLEEEIDLVENSGYKTATESKNEKQLIDMQLSFIEEFKKILSGAENKKELQNLIYKFRYYIYLPIKVNGQIIEIKDVPELKPELEKFEKKLITKACKQKALIIINQDISYNAKIMQKILNTKQIELSDITAIFTKEKDQISISVFDGDVLDRTESVTKDKEKDFRIKFDKKIKLFI